MTTARPGYHTSPEKYVSPRDRALAAMSRAGITDPEVRVKLGPEIEMEIISAELLEARKHRKK